MDLKGLDRHRVILGWCFVGMGALVVLVALIVLGVMATGGLLANDPDARRALPFMGAVLAALTVLFALPALLAGVGLLRRRYWGKVLALVIGLLNVANVPLGTALFAYTLWFWLQSDSEALFHRRRTPPRQGPPGTPRPLEGPSVGVGDWSHRQPT